MPTPSTFQTNSMPMAPGTLAPGLDANGFIPNIAFLFRVVAKTADYTVLGTESGTIFTTYGATAAVTFTLPAPASTTSGTWYIFYSAADVNMVVASGTADKMVAVNDLAADSVSYATTSLIIGGGILVFCDGTLWYSMALPGQATQTVTVAT